MAKRADLKQGLGLELKGTPGEGLSGQFIFPPFSILRATDGKWQQRKKQWLVLGIESEVGRGAISYNTNGMVLEDKKKGFIHKGETIKKGDKWQQSGTSIFDPVLCELMYSWFCPNGGIVIDPFAGGSVRGIVAGYMGLKYYGIELRLEQVEANKVQKKTIIPKQKVKWIEGDANEKVSKAPKCDFIFTCPPYGDLEVYSDLKGDISNMGYPEFKEAYFSIIKKACERLKENRFTCFVVANYRDTKTGGYYDLVGDTVQAFTRAGLLYYNEIILSTAIGSLPVRTGKQFKVGRKVGKNHQNILVFYKGDQKEIRNVLSPTV